MWRQIALPVIGVAISWLIVSGSTNFYLQWLDDSYQRVFDENIASIHAASQMQQKMWRLHAEVLAQWNQPTDWSSRLATFESDLQSPVEILKEKASTADERLAVADISRQITNYLSTVREMRLPQSRQGGDSSAIQDRLYDAAKGISTETDAIRQVNDDLLRAHNERRTQISQVVLWARSIAITLVPALGIALGWWTAARMQRSVARIQVTLHDPLLATPGDLGTVQVRDNNELASIQQQVELVVNRLRRSSEELQAARQEVLRAERLAAIGGLAAGVAHELRNPLTSVKLLLQHAGSRGGSATVEARKLALILEEIERMEATIQGLLDFSRPAEPQAKLHDVRQTIERAVHLITGRAEKQRVTTKLDLSDRPLLINGDPQQLHQVFVNLLINAIEAMPNGGILRVVTKVDRPHHQVAIQIHDTGEGIPPDLLPRLFEPFATAKERGTGLGLAVSRRILEEHRGTIDVHPHQPHGTMFQVVLPLLSQSEPAMVAAL
jgi:signal transduction histidine kinase